jgi:CPA2 family monovalent cation:H+ antiporter-2
VALVLGLYVSLNKIAVRALGTLTLERNRELTLVLAVIVGLGSAWIAHRAGISPSLGAFVSGMFLGSSPFATQIRSDVSSLRTILLTLFFGAAGMVANPLWIAQHPLLVLGVTIIVIAGKMLVVWAIFRGLGQPHQVAAATGICLAQVGEFAFVLGSIGLANGVISFETELLVVSVTITTLFVSPFLTPQAVNLGTQFTRAIGVKGVNRLIRPGTEHDHPRVIIVGFGPAGQSAAEPFENQPDLVHILDLSRRNIARAKSMGFSGHIGDAAQAEVLEHVHVASALAVVVTIPDQIGAMRVLQEVRRLAPHAHLIVRSRYQRYTQDYAAAGASVVVGDEEEAGAGIHRAIQHWLQSQPMHADPESPGKKIWNLKYQHPESA